MRVAARSLVLPGVALAVLLAASGCTSGSGGEAGQNGVAGSAQGGSSAAGGGTNGAGSGSTTSCTSGTSLASARLLLISDAQYRNVVHDVFGVTFPSDSNVTAPPSSSGTYSFNESAEIQATTLQAYQRAADQVIAAIASFPPCAPNAVDAACMEQYLRQTLPLAWRRPLTDAEIAGLMALFNQAAPDGQARQVQLALEGALLHPAFLYRSEIGTDAATATGKVQLTAHELAAAVSFALLGSVPDAELWSKAQDGSLTQPTVLAAQVKRLLSLDPVRNNLLKKVSFYLNFEALPFIHKTDPEFGPLQNVLYQSSQRFLQDIVWQGHFQDLFTSRRVYANEALAKAYGLPPVSGTELQALTTSGPAYDSGVLTQPALLAATTKNAEGDDVIHRGLWVYYNLLCAPALPPPPPNATSVAATLTGSTREQTMTRANGCGLACHGRFDPFGLVTLSYDTIGRYRTTDPTSTPPGAPIDASATISAGVLNESAEATLLHGIADVARAFASGRQVSDCAAITLATYAMDHNPDAEGSCEIQVIKDRFQSSGSFSDLFEAVLNSPAFATRDIQTENP